MRLLAFVAALIAMAAAALAGQVLWQVVQDPVPARTERDATTDAMQVVQNGQARAPLRDWPALFGARVIPEPQPPRPPKAEPEPQPPAPPMPPLESLGYSLQGVVRNGDNSWAMVSHPTGEQLLKVGDMLNEDYTVSAIDVQGLWVTTARGSEPQLLGFAK